MQKKPTKAAAIRSALCNSPLPRLAILKKIFCDNTASNDIEKLAAAGQVKIMCGTGRSEKRLYGLTEKGRKMLANDAGQYQCEQDKVLDLYTSPTPDKTVETPHRAGTVRAPYVPPKQVALRIGADDFLKIPSRGIG